MLSEGGTLFVPSQFHSAAQHSEPIMTPWQKRTTSLTQRMADDMRVRNYSQRTIDAYTYHVGRFADFLSRSPESASPEDVRSFHKGNALDPMRATARNFESAHDVRSLIGGSGTDGPDDALAPDRKAKEQLVVIQPGRLWATDSLSNHVSPRLGCQYGALRQTSEATASGAQRGRSFTTDCMRRQPEASHVPADSVFHRNAAERSGTPEDCRCGQPAHAASHRLGQRSERTTRPAVTTTADRTAGVLEAVSSVGLSVSRQDARCAVRSDDHSEGLQSGGREGGASERHHTSHPASQFCDTPAGSRSRSADDQSPAWSRELQYDDEVSACATTASEQCAVAGRLASRASASRLGAATQKSAAGTVADSADQPRVIDILRRHAAEFVAHNSSAACDHVQSTLAKISLCRTPPLGASWHWCAHCSTGVRIPNSCGDRHCPQCRGAQRVTWVDTMQPLLLPGVDVFQVVFTIPDALSSLTLGNRRAMFRLLFHAAWQSLKTVIENEQQFEAAAAMVLHTWNQHLESHVHLHAVVPGGGPSLRNPEQWKSAAPPPHQRQDRWWLVDAEDLRAEFRKRFLKGLRALHSCSELKLDGDWLPLRDADRFEEFLAPLESKSWVTYIEPPPPTSRPEDVVKYLARYLTGGPISDRRLLSYDGRQVVFTARKGTTHGGSDETEQVTMPAGEFVRRWCLHILPSGFTRSRRFGGWSSQHRERYMDQCRQLREQPSGVNSDGSGPVELEALPVVDSAADERPCPTCGHGLERLEVGHRTSWRDIFSSDDRPVWYRIRERG